MVKLLSAIQKTWVQSLGWEDPREKEMATHSSTLVGKIPWTEKPDRLQSMESQSQTRLSDFTFTFTFYSFKISDWFQVFWKTYSANDFADPVSI